MSSATLRPPDFHIAMECMHPNEVNERLCTDELVHIFEFLNPAELFSTGHVCSQWNHLTSDHRLWKRVLRSGGFLEDILRWGNRMLILDSPAGKRKFRDQYVADDFSTRMEQDIEHLLDIDSDSAKQLQNMFLTEDSTDEVDFRSLWIEFHNAATERCLELMRLLVKSGIVTATSIRRRFHTKDGKRWRTGRNVVDGWRAIVHHDDYDDFPLDIPDVRTTRIERCECLHKVSIIVFWIIAPLFALLAFIPVLILLIVSDVVAATSRERVIVLWVAFGVQVLSMLFFGVSLVETCCVHFVGPSCMLSNSRRRAIWLYNRVRPVAFDFSGIHYYIQRMVKNEFPSVFCFPLMLVLFGFGVVFGSVVLSILLFLIFPRTFAFVSIPWTFFCVVVGFLVVFWLFYCRRKASNWGVDFNFGKAFPILISGVFLPNTLLPIISLTVVFVVPPRSSFVTPFYVFGGVFMGLSALGVITGVVAGVFLFFCWKGDFATSGADMVEPFLCQFVYKVVTFNDCECCQDSCPLPALGTTNMCVWMTPSVLAIVWLAAGAYCLGAPVWACAIPLMLGTIGWVICWCLVCFRREKLPDIYWGM